ncbi:MULTISPECIES: uracil-DNA glycosylase family protein [unclassified Massilia]|uniref:uracil-DNA glycosylase n=1 Tax=unclassified Massilia TaxID=2609279 RepID=UPI001B8408B5|nr:MULTISPECIES: uracil-DNA glycosylase [unclassified Massilia]MBQ5941236.1 uracil-DNA glycosylase [Massilia sp. AB1]MBQ5965543.1 uracil-DNA glycosylase [Massilia sp. ZL223]
MKKISERDAVFLTEMGIGPLWQLRSAPEAVDVPEAEEASVVAELAEPPAETPAETPAEAAPAPVAKPAPAPAGDAFEAAWDDAAVPEETVTDIARMDWAALRLAVANCRRCGACSEGRKPMFGSGPRQARWMVVAGTPGAQDEQAGQPVSGDAGKLLENMLHAVGLSRERDAYVTPLVKCRPVSPKGGDRAPTLEEVEACRPYLERELALSGASTVLTLGQVAANGLLGRPLSEPLAGARGAVHRLGEVPLVATLHPGELLRRGQDKALAWADLCRARALDAGGR